MEVDVSYSTLFSDLCVEFASPLRMCRPQAHVEGAKLQNGWVASPLFLSRAVTSTFTESHRRGRGAHRSKGNKSNAYTLPVCVAPLVNASVYLCVHACVCLCVCVCCCRWVATLINSPIPSPLVAPPLLVEPWQVTLVSCTASGEVTVPDNIIYIVCRERLEHGSLIYATLGDLPVLPSPGPIHQMVVSQCRFIGPCPWDNAE